MLLEKMTDLSGIGDSSEVSEGSSKGGGSSLCPSKSTVYLGNIPYSLTNNDLFKLLEHCGKIVCTKIVKDRETRKSKGYAFIQFLNPESANKCVEEYDGATVFDRKFVCNIAKDNGRAAEFIRKRTYPDKTRCYECGEFGHLSYACPKNALGDRQPPPKKKKKKGKGFSEDKNPGEEDSEGDEEEDANIESLSAAISYQRAISEEQDYRESVASGNYGSTSADLPKKRKFVKDEYFSDEELLTDD